MIQKLGFGFAVCLMGMYFVWGDTVRLKDGTTLYGKAVQLNENSVRISFEKGSMTIPASQIASIEENDKVSDLDLNKVHPLAEKRRQELSERTGLTGEQRTLIRKAMGPLNSSDPMAVAEARQRLVALNKEMNVFQFLDASLPYLTDRYVPEVMRTMSEIDPERALPVLRERTLDVSPQSRGAAVELLGKVGGAQQVLTIARGLVDHEPEVRIAAAKGLAIAKDKGATPALLEGLDSAEAQVRNACRAALRAIWSTDSNAVDFESSNQWKGFWASRVATIEKTVDPARLAPLVVPEPPAVATYHDE